MTEAEGEFYAGGRHTPNDKPGPFDKKVVTSEEDLLDRINRRRVQKKLSSRALDELTGRKVNLGTILTRKRGTRTATIFALLDALDLEVEIRPREKSTRLQRAIGAKQDARSATEPAGGPEE